MRKFKWAGKEVLMILPTWDSTYRNKNVGKIIAALMLRDARMTVYCRIPGDSADIKDFMGNKIKITSPAPGFFLTPFVRLLQARKFDLVLWTYSGYHENFILLLSRFFNGPRYIIKSDSRLHYPLNSLKKIISMLMFFFLPGKFADLIVVETPEIEKKATRLYKRSKLCLLPNGVPVSRFEQLKKDYALELSPLKVPYILCPRRVCHEKGIDLLIESFALVSAQIPDWNIEIVGPVWDENYYEYCQQLVQKHGLMDRVHFHSEKKGTDLYRFYNFSDFCVLPSRKEGLANILPEAMYFGNPVVAFDIGQTRSMINDDTGILVPAGDTNGFADAILKLASNGSLRAAMAAKLQAFIEQNYNDDVLLEGFLNRCEEIPL